MVNLGNAVISMLSQRKSNAFALQSLCNRDAKAMLLQCDLAQYYITMLISLVINNLQTQRIFKQKMVNLGNYCFSKL